MRRQSHSLIKAVVAVSIGGESASHQPPTGYTLKRNGTFAGVGPPRRAAEIEVMVYEFPQAEVQGQGGRKEQSGGGPRRWSSKAIWMRSGCSSGCIYWALLLWDCFAVTNLLSQKHRSAFLRFQDADLTPSIGGFRLKSRRLRKGRQFPERG